GCVEDFTGKGLLDLRAGIIRTPLPARDTFMDDPLRALRAVRFGTRFGFELDTELMQAAASEQVCSALADKVSKERVGTELKGMFDDFAV
ncbi:polyA_pol domain-containing protein, partial [Haematococcus lacustris]